MHGLASRGDPLEWTRSALSGYLNPAGTLSFEFNAAKKSFFNVTCCCAVSTVTSQPLHYTAPIHAFCALATKPCFLFWGHANHRGHNSCMHVIACVLKWRHIVSAINAHAYDHHYSQGESPLPSCPVLNRGHLSIIHFHPSSKTVWILLIWTNFLLYSWTYRDPVPLTFRVMGDRGSKHTILRSYLV